jgi:glycerophosphoryl diester phosphodiesterase
MGVRARGALPQCPTVALPSLLDPPVTFAHRGARAHAEENTLEAFRLALRLGADGVWSEAWLTADGVVVLHRRGRVRVRARARPMGELRRSQLPSQIVSVADLVEATGGQHHVGFDVPDAATAAAVIDAVAQAAPALGDRLWLAHPDVEMLTSWRALDADVRLVDATRLRLMREGPERRAATLAARGIDGVRLHHTDWTGGLTTLFHRFERLTMAVALEHEHLLRAVLRMGIDAVASDWADRMVDAVRATRSG